MKTYLIVSLLTLFLFGCSEEPPKAEQEDVKVADSEGIYLTKKPDSSYIIENRSDVSLRIRLFEYYGAEKTEQTKWIKIIRPGEVISREKHEWYTPDFGIYIYSANNGALIGFLKN